MRRAPVHPSRSAVRLGLALTLLLAIAPGCTVRDANTPLRGDLPHIEQRVDQVRLDEVSADGSTRPFEMRAKAGGWLIVFFGFVTCPDICPTTLSDVKRAMSAVGPIADRVSLAFITVDPVRDSAAVLVPYLGSFFESRAHALRPTTQAELGAAQTAFRATSTITRLEDGHIDVSHTAITYIVDEHGQVRLMWPFGTSAADMAHDLRALSSDPARTPIASADGAKAMFEGAWARSSPAGVTLGAGYLTIRSAKADRLLGASVTDEVAGSMELHEVLADSAGALRMRRVDSVQIPGGEDVVFRPGGRHLMFIDLKRPLRSGDRVDVKLRFEHSGERSVMFEVKDS